MNPRRLLLSLFVTKATSSIYLQMRSRDTSGDHLDQTNRHHTGADRTCLSKLFEVVTDGFLVHIMRHTTDKHLVCLLDICSPSSTTPPTPLRHIIRDSNLWVHLEAVRKQQLATHTPLPPTHHHKHSTHKPTDFPSTTWPCSSLSCRTWSTDSRCLKVRKPNPRRRLVMGSTLTDASTISPYFPKYSLSDSAAHNHTAINRHAPQAPVSHTTTLSVTYTLIQLNSLRPY